MMFDEIPALIWEIVLLIILGFSGGVAVGSGFVAFITVLDVIPRLTQVTRSGKFIFWYELVVVVSVFMGTIFELSTWKFNIHYILLPMIGIFAGTFIGMLAAALTEVLNVFPILTQRLGMEAHLEWFLMAMIIGKVAGSLFQWFFY